MFVQPTVNEGVVASTRHGDHMTDENCSRIVSDQGEMSEDVVDVDRSEADGKENNSQHKHLDCCTLPDRKSVV